MIDATAEKIVLELASEVRKHGAVIVNQDVQLIFEAGIDNANKRILPLMEEISYLVTKQSYEKGVKETLHRVIDKVNEKVVAIYGEPMSEDSFVMQAVREILKEMEDNGQT